jgi:phage terminase small subunit
MADKKPKPITPKERMFVGEYLTDKNGSRAYMAVFKTKNPRAAAAMASRLLTKPRVKAYLDLKLKEQEEALGFTAQDVLRKLWAVSDVDLQQLLKADGSVKPVSEWPKGYGKLLAGIKIDELFEGAGRDREQIGFTKEIKLEGRTGALTQLGRYFKLFTDKSEIAGKDGGPLIVRWEE